MASRRNEVEQSMDTVIPEPRVTPNPGLLCEDIVILTVQIANDLLEAIMRILGQRI